MMMKHLRCCVTWRAVWKFSTQLGRYHRSEKETLQFHTFIMTRKGSGLICCWNFVPQSLKLKFEVAVIKRFWTTFNVESRYRREERETMTVEFNGMNQGMDQEAWFSNSINSINRHREKEREREQFLGQTWQLYLKTRAAGGFRYRFLLKLLSSLSACARLQQAFQIVNILAKWRQNSDSQKQSQQQC